MSALEIIYNEYYQKIFYTAYEICHNKDVAYDIAMEILLKLSDFNIDPHSIKNHKAYVVTMTKNQTKDYLRKNQKTISLEECVTAVMAEEKSDKFFIDDILKLLNDDERVVFIEHIVWDKTLKVIAKEQQKPYITIKRLFAEIKKKIKTSYKLQ